MTCPSLPKKSAADPHSSATSVSRLHCLQIGTLGLTKTFALELPRQRPGQLDYTATSKPPMVSGFRADRFLLARSGVFRSGPGSGLNSWRWRL